MEFMITLFAILFLSYVLSVFFSKIGLPKILAPIILGAVFTAGSLKNLFFTGETMYILNFIKDIAIIFLMFFVGLKIDLRHFRKSSKKAVYIAVMAASIPFVLGFGTVVLGYHTGILESFFPDPDKLFMVAYVVGLCLSITAEVVAIEILEELGVLHSLMGETIIEAGLVDSIIGVILLSGLIAFIPSSVTSNMGFGTTIIFKLVEIAVFALVVYLLAKFVVPPIMKDTEKQKSRDISFFTVSVTFTLFLAIISKVLDFGGSILGALIAGMVIRHTLLAGDRFEKKEERALTDIIEITTFGFFAPYFFFWIGLSTDFYILATHPLFAVIIIGFALVGKFAGTLLGNKMGGGTLIEGAIISWGMNTKGEVDIMVATLMFSLGVLNKDLFSSLVFMSFFVTLISPVMFKLLVRRHHGL